MTKSYKGVRIVGILLIAMGLHSLAGAAVGISRMTLDDIGMIAFMLAIDIAMIAGGVGLFLKKTWGWWTSVAMLVFVAITPILLSIHEFFPGSRGMFFIILIPTTVLAILCLLWLFRDDSLEVFGIRMFLRTRQEGTETDRAVGGRRKRMVYKIVLLLLVVLVIYGVARIGLSVYATLERLKIGAATGTIGAFNSALKLYREDVTSGQLPEHLVQVVDDDVDGWGGPYMATITHDPWGNDYIYRANGTDYTLMSIHDQFYFDNSETIRYNLSNGEITYLPPKE